MVTVRKPQKVNSFPEEYRLVVERTYERGTHFIRCASEREAHSLKFQLRRYLASIPFYQPETELAQKCARIKVRHDGCDIELVNMEKDSVTLSLRQSLEEGGEGTIDPAAKVVHSFDDDFAELRRLEAAGKLPGTEDQ